MLTPIVFSLDPLNEGLSLTWFFYKAISYINKAKDNSGMVIAQKQYFDMFEKQKELFPEYFIPKVADYLGYDIPSYSDIEKTKRVEITDDIIENYIGSKSSKSDAYVASFLESIPELENYIIEKIQDYEENTGFEVEGFVSFRHYKFIQNISKMLNKPVFYFEWAAFRNPIYRNYAYFDLNYSYKNYYKRFCDFTSCNRNKVKYFSKEEMFSLFIMDEQLELLEKDFKKNEFEVGLAGGYNALYETDAYTRYNTIEAYYRSISKFGEDSVLVKYHPGDVVASKVNAKNIQEGDVLDFISKSKRIIAINSNIEFEAMLLGKPVYDETEVTRFKGFVNNDINLMNDRIATVEEINFLAFVCFVPYELVDDINYIKWRLTNPSDLDLFYYHRKYLLEKMCMDESILSLDDNDRLEVIMNIRKGIIAKNSLERERRLVQLIREKEEKETQLERLSEENANLKKQIESLESHYQDELNNEKEKNIKQIETMQELSSRCEYLCSEINRINSSKSMKLTAPLRNIRNIIRR